MRLVSYDARSGRRRATRQRPRRGANRHGCRWRCLQDPVAALLRAADGTPKRLGRTGAERDALVAFLGTLTDSSFLTAVRFSNPFAPGSITPPTGPTITMKNNTFSPATVTVPAGAVVSFLNIDNELQPA